MSTRWYLGKNMPGRVRAKIQRSDASWHSLGMVNSLCGCHVGFESENSESREIIGLDHEGP